MKYAGEGHFIELIYMCCSVFCSQGYRHLITNGKNKKQKTKKNAYCPWKSFKSCLAELEFMV